ncbi:hypothetical protein SNK03_006643 [Fusarium graminearum]
MGKSELKKNAIVAHRRRYSISAPKEAFAIAEDHELDDLSKNNDKLGQGVAKFLGNYNI